MNVSIKENLLQIKNLLAVLPEGIYSKKSQYLSQVSIGQHVRHILEFYYIVLKSNELNCISYDNRLRDGLLEIEVDYALAYIDALLLDTDIKHSNTQLILLSNFNVNDSETKVFHTCYERELAYCLEHSIHHQALIKIALKEFHLDHLIDSNFGVAYSTIRYQESLKTN